MTLLELMALVENEYGDITLPEQKIKDKINIVYRDLSRLYTRETIEKDDDLVTVAGQEIYTLGSDSRQILAVYLGENRLRNIRAEARLFPRPEGTPVRWFTYGMGAVTENVKQRFGLDPVPDEADISITVDYEPMPADLTESDDNVAYIPEEKQHLIAWGAIGILAGIEEDYDIAQNFESRYKNGYNELMIEMGIFRESNYPVTAKQVRQQ
jgi:hypothetical protein